ncbi:DUF6255 family natural product biosynthesis protein [Streptomyces sp. NPDC021100]|uniref:DUF6255 family natural product biosynthesis protein n=1 Tax=Streptomyces sp. NPDC021100 TaxID=3365114 RepID=UPI0037B08603
MTAVRTSVPPVNGPRLPHRSCGHPASAWTTADGIRTCGACGTRRVDDYRALALALELPAPTGLFGPTARCRGRMTIAPHGPAHPNGPVGPTGHVHPTGPVRPTGPAPDRRADLLRRVREANRWSAERRP